MSTHSYVAGVDGGATKTTALIADAADGKILGKGKSGSSNYHNIGVKTATESIRDALKRAMKDARIVGRPEIVVVALAGIDSEKDKRTASHFVRNARMAHKSIVIHDSVAALYTATNGGPGIVVNSGTGSFAAGTNNKGQYARAGGWGYIIGDEGSAYEIGKKAINMAFRSFDKREAHTILVGLLEQRFGVRQLDELVSRVYAGDLTVEKIARLVPLVARAARTDIISRRILANAGIELGELACAVAQRLKMTNDYFTVGAVGGSFKSGHYIMRPFKSRIKEECPNARVVRLRVDPAQGSLAIALAKVSESASHQLNAFLSGLLC